MVAVEKGLGSNALTWFPSYCPCTKRSRLDLYQPGLSEEAACNAHCVTLLLVNMFGCSYGISSQLCLNFHVKTAASV